VLDAPEAACGEGGGLRAGGDSHWSGGRGRGRGEGAEEAGQKGHREVGQHYEKKRVEELQIGPWELKSNWGAVFVCTMLCALRFAFGELS
jgi:hypothetical protein